MARIRTRLPKLTTQIVLWGGGLLLLGGIAWGLGWSLHGVLYPRQAAPPTESAPLPPVVVLEPTVPPTPLPDATSTQSPTSTPQPTSTPLPTAAPEGWKTVQSGETLYQVCRRHCPHRWSPDSAEFDADLTAYAEQVARRNDLGWPDPVVHPGQRLEMPACP